MATIRLSAEVRAPVERCFDLARSVDFHLISTRGTGERVIAGRHAGLLALHEEVTWEARHFGVRQRLTSRITQFTRPSHFRDSQVRGAFAWFHHDHHFDPIASGTRITEVFEFRAPLGVAGRLAERLVLTAYMERFLSRRLGLLQQALETDWWEHFLPAGEG